MSATTVREHRQAAGLTQGQLAEAVGAGRVTIARIEAGTQRPDVDRALALATVLGTTVEALFGSGANIGANTGANTQPERAESR